MKNKEDIIRFNVPIEGSLGLLAFGDIGLRAWRKIKNELNNSRPIDSLNEEE